MFLNSWYVLKIKHANFPLIALLILFVISIKPTDAKIMVYVTNSGSNTVSSIDPASNSVVQTFNVGTNPVGIAADTINDLIYVANGGSSSVTRVNVVSGATTTLSIPGSIPEGIAVTPNGSLILVGSLESVPDGLGTKSRVYVIDGGTFTVSTSVLVADDPEGMVISQDGLGAWVACDLKVQNIDLEIGLNYLNVTDVLVGVDGLDDYEDVEVKNDKSVLFVTNHLKNSIHVINLTTNTIITSVSTGSQPESVKIRPSSSETHVTNQGGDSLTKFNTSTYTNLGTYNLLQNEPRGLDFLPDGSDGFIVMGMDNTVFRYDASTLASKGIIPVGSLPEEVVVFDVTPTATVEDWIHYN